MDAPTDSDRELAKEVAKDAMIMGWRTSVDKKATEMRIHPRFIETILDNVAAFNDQAEPSGRIDELADWKKEKQGVSSLAPVKAPGKTFNFSSEKSSSRPGSPIATHGK